MTSPITLFKNAFDPMNQSHVVWLKKMTDLADSMKDLSQQFSLVKEINTNPMNVTLNERDALAWVEIHFVLAMKYTRAVLNSQAVVPASGLSPITE